jgi:hypothetical protein
VPKLDKLIQRRFQELIQKAQSVQETYHSPVTDGRGNISFYHMHPALFEEWATSALGLLKRIFAKDSVYYQNFQQHYIKTTAGYNFSSYFENCLGAFRAAKEDYDGGTCSMSSH